MTALDLSALLAALDAGDDSVLGPLADALEEAGDARARGFRFAACKICSRPKKAGGVWEWVGNWVGDGFESHRHTISLTTFYRLRGEDKAGQYTRAYRTRSAAFLALAAALSD